MLAKRTALTTDLDLGLDDWSCTSEHVADPRGHIVVLHVAGELDMLTCPALSTALDTAVADLARGAAGHLVVDMAAATFCCVRGFDLLAEAATTATGAGVGYAVSGMTRHLERYSRMLWAEAITPVPCYCSSTAAVAAVA